LPGLPVHCGSPTFVRVVVKSVVSTSFLRLPAWVGPLGLVGVILTVLYAELEADEPPEQEQETREGDQDEAQDKAQEELAGKLS
jgi:hypothetical protein